MNHLVSPEIIEQHRTVLRRYLWSRRGAIRQVPELVAQGANNALYRFHLRGRPLLAKIGMNPFFRQLHVEYAVLKHVGTISPGVFDFFEDDRTDLQVLLLDPVDGEHPYVLDNALLSAAGRAIAAYHTGSAVIDEVPVEQGVSFITDRILQVERYGGRVDYRERYEKIYGSLLSYADQFPLGDRGRMVLVHGDLVPRNIISEPGGALRIIDWEGARYDIPEADLATIVKAYHIEGERRERLFAAYGLPVDHALFNFRLAVHYVQVLAWRLAIQLPQVQEEKNSQVEEEIEKEFGTAEQLLAAYSKTVTRV